MTKMKQVLLSSLLEAALILASCSQDVNGEMSKAGTGNIGFGVSSNATFTKAVDENAYGNTDNYTVQILQGGQEIESFRYADRKESYELSNGTYTLKAFYGTEKNASRNEFYVEGSKNFTVNGNDQAIYVDCYPTCGKALVKFNANMSDFFSDYYVVYETEALTAEGANATWGKADTEPWYLKLNQSGETVKATICLTRKDNGKSSTVEKNYAMKPGKSWTMNITAKEDSGSLGIEITIDESTNDHEIDITVPGNWI